MKPVDRLVEAESELRKLKKERDGLALALGDPKLVSWTHEGGPAPRRLTSFETATAKRIASLDKKIEPLEAECETLLEDVVVGLSGMDAEPDDPEVLLRASLVVLNRLSRAGMSSPESLAVMRMLVRYLKSLADE